ncbi:MAG: hypothetical protein EXX96DRAFT_649323 [Benjaminiella poitrasii]|nr:MAG: hypothetical protein EXX96DRAFT_649323 [Benjaminiella poitrasii]
MSKNHLVLLTLGSRGDLQPLVALAIEYKKKFIKERLTIVAPRQLHCIYQHLYDLYNIDFYSLAQQAKSNSERWIEMKQMWEACQLLKPTKLLYTTFVLEGWSIAEKLKISSAVVSFFSLDLYPIPDDFESELKETFPELYYNQLKSIWHPHVQHWIWRLFLEDIGEFRESLLDLDPIPTCFNPLPPFIYALDPDLFQGNQAGTNICGFWPLLERADIEYQLNQDDNIHQKPVLLINFGSMDTLSPILCNPDDCQTFVKQSKQRIAEILCHNSLLNIVWIISDSNTVLYRLVKAAFNHSRMHIIHPAINHRSFIQNHDVVGIIHHGGMNTCLTMVQLGIPQAIMPFMFDQNTWATKLASISLSKTITINKSWIETFDWMLQSSRSKNSTHLYWQNKVIENTRKGLDNAIEILFNLC